MAVHDTFTSSPSKLDILRSAVASIQQQEVQDRRWTDHSEDRFPVWRPLKCLSTHNALLQNMVESRLLQAVGDELSETSRLSSPVKREVYCLGRRVRDDLLTVARTVRDCYPPEVDILNIYAALYHQRFSARLTELAMSGVDVDDCSYLLFWVNHHYPHEVLEHEDLQGKVKTTCLGSLLLHDHLNRLEHQYLSHTEDKVKLWLNTALKKEEESWLRGSTPELIDRYYFSPLAVDVIQVMNSSLTEFTCVIRDQSKSQKITAYLENFFSSYKKSVEDFVKGNHGNVHSVIKAHLVCEEQFREYITGSTGSLSEQQRHTCLETLSALKDYGYRYLTCPIHAQLKVCYRDLWTSAWLDGSLPVICSLLDSLNRQLSQVLTDLKPTCAESLLSVLHQDVVLHDIHVSALLSLKTGLSAADIRSIRKSVEENRLLDVSTNQRPMFFSKLKVKWTNDKRRWGRGACLC
ncbi:hypothetical protein INR49_006845 [Caranx melampygus]|nr:hypothetical protein INR49_006845 [Caranx melampygus]